MLVDCKFDVKDVFSDHCQATGSSGTGNRFGLCSS